MIYLLDHHSHFYNASPTIDQTNQKPIDTTSDEKNPHKQSSKRASRQQPSECALLYIHTCTNMYRYTRIVHHAFHITQTYLLMGEASSASPDSEQNDVLPRSPATASLRTWLAIQRREYTETFNDKSHHSNAFFCFAMICTYLSLVQCRPPFLPTLQYPHSSSGTYNNHNRNNEMVSNAPFSSHQHFIIIIITSSHSLRTWLVDSISASAEPVGVRFVTSPSSMIVCSSRTLAEPCFVTSHCPYADCFYLLFP
jgi:hypothetical protein